MDAAGTQQATFHAQVALEDIQGAFYPGRDLLCDRGTIEGGNPARTENNEEGRDLDMRLRKLWSKHPSFHFVPHSASFFAKLQDGLRQLQAIVDDNGLLRTDS